MVANSPATNKLRELLIRVSAYNAETKYVTFDNVWYSPDTLRECADILTDFIIEIDQNRLHILPKDRNKLVILSPDNLKSSYGIIPVSVLITQKLDCRFAIWEQLADIRWGTSAIRGSFEEGLTCIVLQDVVQGGVTALEIAHSMKGLNWNFVAYVAAVMNNAQGTKQVQKVLDKIPEVMNHKPSFFYSVTASQLT